ncbi:unnamed protein product [Somion occarium]|uniref:Uncharacterized protein n=1 Tax=Somion occarium TaxID=3059160 RepID=A0ABP1E5Q1_9APHY
MITYFKGCEHHEPRRKTEVLSELPLRIAQESVLATISPIRWDASSDHAPMLSRGRSILVANFQLEQLVGDFAFGHSLVSIADPGSAKGLLG